MEAEEFLRRKFDEHWKNGGKALNISAYAESKIIIWMDEYKQLHQPTVIGALPLCKSCGNGKSFDINYNCFDCGKSFSGNGL